ncbi:uncharacterized protein LOC122013374 isoform X2 [Zingiber officinale]|uniref:uncharacterized protein LOC122013374 isoform X2 n=1 Tax=Zingiber officinale TaxID=94328 RepID=UPI001C4D6636|nr:uncharacterized protein LOC122013374 isoform X2 [Zingiber officinale]
MEVRVSAIASTSTRSLFLRCSCENSPFMFSSGPCCLITSSIGWEVVSPRHSSTKNWLTYCNLNSDFSQSVHNQLHRARILHLQFT